MVRTVERSGSNQRSNVPNKSSEMVNVKRINTNYEQEFDDDLDDEDLDRDDFEDGEDFYENDDDEDYLNDRAAASMKASALQKELAEQEAAEIANREKKAQMAIRNNSPTKAEVKREQKESKPALDDPINAVTDSELAAKRRVEADKALKAMEEADLQKKEDTIMK